jgi:hypothetical protein
MMRVVAVADLSSLLLSPGPAGVQSVARVVVVTEAVMHRGRGSLPAVARRLVDRLGFATVLGKLFSITRGLEDGCIVAVSCRQRTLAGIAPPRC